MTAPMLTIEDVLAAARAVAMAERQGVAPVEAMAALLAARRLAARHMREHGRPHPAHGDGTLAAAARGGPGDRSAAPSTRAILAATACVCEALSRAADWTDDAAHQTTPGE
jgi:hypothetical protein